MKKSINIKQRDITDCGAACLASISAHYKLYLPISKIRQYASTDKKGTNVLGLVEAAEKLGYEVKGVRGTMESIPKIPLPAIAHVIVKEVLHHYIVIYKVSDKYIWIMDPGQGKVVKRALADFEKEWTGVLVLLLPSDEFEKKSEKVSVYKRFWELIKPHKSILIQALFGALIYTILGLSTSIYIQKLTDYVIPNSNYNLLNLLSIILLVLIGLQIFFGVTKSVFTLTTGQHIDARLILGYYKHLLTLPQRFFDTMRVGEIISRINDAVKIRNFINDVSINFILNIFIVLFSFVLMFIYSWRLALVMLIAIPAYSIIYIIVNKLNKKTERKVMEKTASLEANLVESLGSTYTLKAMGAEDYANSKTEMSFVELLKTVYKSGKNSIFASFSSDGVSKIFVLALFWVGSYLVIGTKITVGELFLFYALIGYFNQPITSLIQTNTTIQNALIAADRLFEIMDLEREDKVDRKIKLSEDNITDITIKDVHFSYGTRLKVFEGLNLKIEKNKLTVLAGESGSGKSTIVSLLQNIYPIQSGKISIGNFDIQQISIGSLRKNLVGIPQHIDLFKGTLLENIAIGDYEPDMQKITSLVSTFNFDEFIESLPNGLGNYVEEKGINFSGGQKQKIGIIRALYKEPRIILLDESTSALDLKSENNVIDILKDFTKSGKTVLFVTHRPSIMKKADKIAFLKDGKIVEEGSFNELMNANSFFKDFIESN